MLTFTVPQPHDPGHHDHLRRFKNTAAIHVGQLSFGSPAERLEALAEWMKLGKRAFSEAPTQDCYESDIKWFAEFMDGLEDLIVEVSGAFELAFELEQERADELERSHETWSRPWLLADEVAE